MTGAQSFSSLVARVYATRLLQFACTVAVAFLLARLLGPDGRGVYSLLLLLPSTLFAVGQLGLPSALTFYAGAGRSLRSLVVAAIGLGAVFLHLDAELNFYRLFNETIEDFSLHSVSERQSAAFNQTGVPLPR